MDIFYAASPRVSGVSWFDIESERDDWIADHDGFVVPASRVAPEIREQAKAWLWARDEEAKHHPAPFVTDLNSQLEREAREID